MSSEVRAGGMTAASMDEGGELASPFSSVLRFLNSMAVDRWGDLGIRDLKRKR